MSAILAFGVHKERCSRPHIHVLFSLDKCHVCAVVVVGGAVRRVETTIRNRPRVLSYHLSSAKRTARAAKGKHSKLRRRAFRPSECVEFRLLCKLYVTRTTCNNVLQVL